MNELLDHPVQRQVAHPLPPPFTKKPYHVKSTSTHARPRPVNTVSDVVIKNYVASYSSHLELTSGWYHNLKILLYIPRDSR